MAKTKLKNNKSGVKEKVGKIFATDITENSLLYYKKKRCYKSRPRQNINKEFMKIIKTKES